MTYYRKSSGQFSTHRKTYALEIIAGLAITLYVGGLVFAAKPAVAKDQLYLESLEFGTQSALFLDAEPRLIGLTADKPLTIDEMVHKYATKYGKTRYEQNRLKALTHFLLLREQNYGGSDNCGDSGLACGPLQFHEGTYTANRKTMIKKGLAQEMGSRLDMENAIDTAIYMFSIGQEKQWGPYLRGEIKL